MKGVWTIGGCLLMCAMPKAFAQQKQQALFVVAIGVNSAQDPELKPLHYADDDAARYFDLFRFLGARTTLLAEFDENTKRLHSQAAAEAKPPTFKALQETIEQVSSDIQQAHAQEIEAVLYFIYAGHGNLRGGQGTISLLDQQLSGANLAELVANSQADWAHIIVDACYSYYLVFSRGPGGSRREAQGFSQVEELVATPHVGLLLSTSSARESHEWEAFQAGVFSHEVRSGLFGAADVDHDGQISYREIAAFVEKANQAIPNERYRPRVYSKAPTESNILLDLKPALDHRLEVEGDLGAHYYFENAQGVRLADFHNGRSELVRIVRPPIMGRLYLHRVVDDVEFEIPSQNDVVWASALVAQAPRSSTRGAAHESFGRLFEMPFDKHWVDEYTPLSNMEELAEVVDSLEEPKSNTLEIWGWSSLGVGATALIAGGLSSWSAIQLRDQVSMETSQQETAEINQKIELRNRAAVSLYIVAGCAVTTGLILLFWPETQASIGLGGTGSGIHISVGGTF